MIAIYLMGVLISKCISSGVILAQVFEDITVLDSRYSWLILFFFTSVVFSFRDVAGTKIV